MELRPYQMAAADAVERAFGRGFRSCLVQLPTGTGKTILFAALAERAVLRGERVLVLAHRGELLEQAIDKIRRTTGIEAGLEKAEIDTRHGIDGVLLRALRLDIRKPTRSRAAGPRHHLDVRAAQARSGTRRDAGEIEPLPFGPLELAGRKRHHERIQHLIRDRGGCHILP